MRQRHRLATSEDRRMGVARHRPPTRRRHAWDKYCRRINSVLPLNGKYYAFYDDAKAITKTTRNAPAWPFQKI